ncbi:MAG: putative toxin-antitoxin system toxin component, PIN family [Candidatus Sumerlaeaceae bacterium]
MKVVIDTNVLVSAMLSPGVSRRVLLFIADHDQIQWLATNPILNEYIQVISRPKFRFPQTLIENWTRLFSERITVIAEPIERALLARDPKDTIFIDCALAGNAEFLISGDSDLSGLKLPSGTIVLNPAAFELHLIQ